MAKRKKRSMIALGIQDSTPPARKVLCLVILTVLFFLATCLGSVATYKVNAVILICAALIFGLICLPVLRNRVRLPLIVLSLFVMMSGISTAYALSGKFALQEFSKLVIAFCIALILLAITPGEGVTPGRHIATILEGSVALSALLSVDLISTRLISTPFLGILKSFSPDFGTLTVIIPNTRITSIFENPNIFGGCAGIGVILALGLSLSSKSKKERCFHICCLYITATAFILAFSMGAIAAIAVGFFAYLLLETKDRRGELLLLMVKTLVLVLISVAIIAATSFDAWDKIQPIPLLCLIAGSGFLCLADRFVGQKLSNSLRGGIKSLIIILIALVLIVGFVVTAYTWTDSITLDVGQTVRRSIYLEPGEYSISTEGNNISVSVYAQSRDHILLGMYPSIFSGNLAGSKFTVPENTEVVFFYLTANETSSIDNVIILGENTTKALPLDYKLLPTFIETRIQGLFTSRTAIERFYLFENGLDLFKTSPIFGLGMGSFETAIYSVQSFDLETKYVHNHYIQTMLESGIIGLILFVGTLGISLACVLVSRFGKKKENCHPLTPALGAALVFMAIHGGVEVTFSAYPFLPLGFGVFALINLCCGDAISPRWLTKKVQTWILIVIAVLMIFFAVLLGNNMTARRIADTNLTFDALERSIKLDKFEWADYKLSYVMSSINSDVPEEIEQKAAEYAEDLSKLSSNTVPFHLTNYYFTVDQTEKAMEMAEKYVRYCSADSEAWNNIFNLLASYESSNEAFVAGVQRISELLDERNATSLSTITLDEAAQSFLTRVLQN